MSENQVNIGLIEVDFGENQDIENESYLQYLGKRFKKSSGIDPIITGRAFGKNVFFTFVKYQCNPSQMLWHCRAYVPECSHFIDCYESRRALKSQT